MTQGERVHAIRKHYGLTMEKFGERLGVRKTSISNIENGIRSLTEQMTLSICREFNVNETWLRTGEGEMFNEYLDEDEVAAYVSELLEPDNPFADLIIEIMRAYSQLKPDSQKALKDFAQSIVNNMENKKED